jgi:hypothetical protein
MKRDGCGAGNSPQKSRYPDGRMTWVVGTPTMFGYCFGLSDICLTLADETEVACLQEIHPVGRYVATGFAGDVEIEFAMIGC